MLTTRVISGRSIEFYVKYYQEKFGLPVSVHKCFDCVGSLIPCIDCDINHINDGEAIDCGYNSPKPHNTNIVHAVRFLIQSLPTTKHPHGNGIFWVHLSSIDGFEYRYDWQRMHFDYY